MKKIGFVNIYPWRPHVEHTNYLAEILSKENDLFGLVCPGSKSVCYHKFLKNTNITECFKCRFGSISNNKKLKITYINQIKSNIELQENEIDESLVASSATLHREEDSNKWLDSIDLKETRKLLRQNFIDTFHSTVNWIKNNNLDFLIIFNGRVDMNSAACIACKKLKIPFLSHERPWMGHGLQLLPNVNCLSLKERSRIVREYEYKNLNKNQLILALDYAISRFTNTNNFEYKKFGHNYDLNTEWPINDGNKVKVLILPSSQREFAGNEEYKNDWKNNVEALDAFLDSAKIDSNQVVLKPHPAWNIKVGKYDTQSAIEIYTKWSEKRGIFFYPISEKISTYSLLKFSDIVILNGSTSAIEAGLLGKKIINLGKSIFHSTDFVKSLLNYEDIKNFRGFNKWIIPDEIKILTLRFIYTQMARFPQFYNNVRAVQTTKYKFYDGGDYRKILKIIEKGKIEADDKSFATDNTYEKEMIKFLEPNSWNDFEKIKNKYNKSLNLNSEIKLNSGIFNLILNFRELWSRGHI